MLSRTLRLDNFRMTQPRKATLEQEHNSYIRSLPDDPEIRNAELTDYFLNNGEIIYKYFDHSSSIHTGPLVSKSELYDKYQMNNNAHYLPPPKYDRSDEYCTTCRVYREPAVDAGRVCPSCGSEAKILVESEKSNPRDNPHENTCFAYERINHFKDHIARYQGKESTSIDPNVLSVIRYNFNREHGKDLSQLNENMVRRYLKNYISLGYNKYYENIYKIIGMITGYQAIVLTPEIEETLYTMFRQLESAYEYYPLPDRSSFIPYPYIVYKFFQLLDLNVYAKMIRRETEKWPELDKYWKKYCDHLGWNYIS